jgi:hypothetical protein
MILARSRIMTTNRQQVKVKAGRKLHLDLELPPDWPQGEVEIQVSVVPSKKTPNGATFVEAVKRLQAKGGVKSIPDPVAWQREERGH